MYVPGAAFSPMIASLVLGFARATESSVLATTKTPLYCHTDSITTLDCEPNLDLPAVKWMETYGGGLDLKWTADRFWSPRAAVYWAKRTDGKYEGAHHATHVEDKHWYSGIEQELSKAKPDEYWPRRFPPDWPHIESRGKPIYHGVVFFKYKPASWKDHVDHGLPLTTEIEQISTTDFHWDDKRELTEEDRNVMARANPARPWESMEALIAKVPIRGTVRKGRGRIETIKERLDRQTGRVGRPRIITAEILATIRRLHDEGLSNREIARRVGKCDRKTIDRVLKRVKNTNA